MDENPTVTLHPDCGFEVDDTYECPLDEEREYTLAEAHDSATHGCPRCILRYVAAKQILPESPGSTKIECTHDYIFLPFWVQSHRFVFAWNDDYEEKCKPGNDNDNDSDSDDDEPVLCSFYGQDIGGIDLVERVVPCDTSSLRSFQTIRMWIKRCDEEHGCIPESVVPKLPYRVLDIRNDRILLRESSNEESDRYACLSHRWGTPSDTMFRTTSSTLSAFKEEIPWASLPRTFQDAVSVTRRLGLDFLWIDSLCIIQDDARDWQQQSANMATIYQNAFITLAATNSDGPEGGLYTREDNPRLHRSGSPLAVVSYQNGIKRELFARRQFSHNIKSLPLLQRGWVYQERALSPRMLHFVGEELVWECGHKIECECGADDLENKLEHPRISDHDDENNNSYVGPVSAHPHTVRSWMQVITDYTALSLTYANDVFPALSGIAKVFAAKTYDEYVAGMWKSTLVPNLLWYFTEESVDLKTIAQPWRAPSWSWASVYSRSDIRFLPVVTQELTEVKDIVCQPSGIDPTGELVTAHLTFHTKALPAVIKRDSQALDSVAPQYSIILDNDFTIPKATRSSSHSLFTLGTGHIDLSDSRLNNGIEHLDIVLAQIASGVEKPRVWLHNIYPPIPFVQEIRSYMLLARQEDNNERWIRIGLALIAEHEPDIALYGPCPESVSRADKEKRVRRMTPEVIERKLEERAERNRQIFRRFDDAGLQNLTVW